MAKKTERKWKDAIPQVAHEHIRIECGKVSRRFHLNEDDESELVSHISAEVRCAVAKKFDRRKGRIFTFIQRVVRNQLCKWMNREVRRRNDLCALATAIARSEARRLQRVVNGHDDSVDDSTYSEEEQWSHGEILPEKTVNEEAEWDPEGLCRLIVIADVRHVVSEMKGRSRRICELFLKELSLRQINGRIKCGSRQFFSVMWPQCKADFVDKAEELGKHFEGQR